MLSSLSQVTSVGEPSHPSTVRASACRPPTQVHQHLAVRIELDDRVRALVDDPQVVVPVVTDRVAVTQRVDPAADLLDELALAVEQQDLGGGIAEQRSAG